MKTDIRRWAAAIFLVLAIGGTAPGETVAADEGVVWEKTERSFLPTFEEKDFTGTLSFKNAGGKPIRVAKIATSCGCTTGTTDKPEYPAGETGVLTIHVDLKKFLYEATRVFQVAVTWEDKTTSMVSVKIKTPGTLKFFPTAVFWKKGEPLQPKEIRIDLESKSFAETLTASSSDPAFSLELVPQVKGQTYRMIITPKEGAGPKTGIFSVEAKFANKQVTRGTVSGRIVGP